MADTKISGLTSLTTPAGEDLVVVVDDPGGTPQTKKVTLANLLDNYIEGNIGSLPTSAITSGTFDNGRIAETNVTQHQAALTITESQISDLGSYITAVSQDTSPALGGNLNVGANSIISSSNGNITLAPNGTGNVVLGTVTIDGDQTVGAGQDNFVLTYDHASGTVRLEAAQDLSTDVTLAGSGTYLSLSGQEITVDPITESDIADLGSYIENVVEDTTPQLGGNLDVNTNSIVSTANGDITIAPNGTGNVILGNYTIDADATIGAGQDNYVLTYDDASGTWRPEAAPGAGGGISNVVEDTTPQLGGSLDVNGQKIVSVSNGNIDIEPNGTGNVLLGNFTFDADQTVGAGQDNYVLTYDNSSGTIRLEVTQDVSTDVTLTGTGTYISLAGQQITVDPITESDISDLGAYIENVVEDTTPQLGGALDVNGQSIVSTANGNITIAPNGTGNVVLGNYTLDADATVGAGQDNYVLTYDHSSGTWGPEAAAGGGGLTLPYSDGDSVTGSASTTTFELTPTWNTTGAPKGISLTVTNTASGADSRLFSVDDSADVAKVFAVGVSDNPFNRTAFTMGTQHDVWYGAYEGYWVIGANLIGHRSNNTWQFGYNASVRRLITNSMGWTTSSVFTGLLSSYLASDAVIEIDAANVLNMRKGSNGQSFRVSNTWTDASNNEFMKIGWNSNVLELGPVANGTGTLRGMKVGVTSSALLGFYGATPVAQQSTTGTTTGFTAGAGTSANDDSTYTGNTGSTAYTVGDIVRALKNLGFLAA